MSEPTPEQQAADLDLSTLDDDAMTSLRDRIDAEAIRRARVAFAPAEIQQLVTAYVNADGDRAALAGVLTDLAEQLATEPDA